jgi:hypothetical protein
MANRIIKREIKSNRIVDPISNIIVVYRNKSGQFQKEVDLRSLLPLINDIDNTFTSMYWKGLEPKTASETR